MGFEIQPSACGATALTHCARMIMRNFLLEMLMLVILMLTMMELYMNTDYVVVDYDLCPCAVNCILQNHICTKNKPKTVKRLIFVVSLCCASIVYGIINIVVLKDATTPITELTAPLNAV